MRHWAGIRGTYENRVVLILAIVGGVAAIDLLAFSFLSSFIATDLHLSNGEIGLVGGTGLLTWAVGAISSAWWSDKVRRRRIFLVGALLCFALFSTVTAFVTSFLALVAARLLVGLTEGPVVPMQSVIMHAESSPHRRGMNMGMVQNLGANLLGGIAGPLILIAIAAAPALAMAAIVRFAIREPAQPAVSEPASPLWQTIRAIVAVHNIRICFLIGTCAVGWFATTTVFIPLWAIRQLHFEPGGMSVVMACLGLGGAVASVVVPALSDRYGRRPVLVAFALIGIVTPIGMLLRPASVSAACLVVLAGTLFTGILPLFIGIIPMESVQARHSATALSFVMGCAQIAGSIVGPLLGGALADRFSLAAPFWLSLGLALGTAFIGLFLTETAPSQRRPAALT